MCRIFGIRNFDYQKHKAIIQKFFLLAENGKVPPNNKKGHLDGWGIGWYEDEKPKVYKSGNSVLEEKTKFFKQLKEIKKSKFLIVHFRKSAWKNTNSKENSHPFKDDETKIIFAHNGTIKNYQNIFKYISNKDFLCLDSETYFLLLTTNYKKVKNLKEAFFKTIKEIKSECEFSSLTCIFSDSHHLYCFREFTNLPEYYTLYLTEKDNSTIISSEKLDKTLKWQIIKPSKLIII